MDLSQGSIIQENDERTNALCQEDCWSDIQDDKHNHIGGMSNTCTSRISKKIFKCDVCKKSYSKRNSLTRHSRIHTNERPFTCEICMKSFTQKVNLRSHILTHNNEKSFKCEICSKTFTQKCYLSRHLYRHRYFLGNEILLNT
jgi:Zinc finger, C2H2 type.